MKPSYTDFDRVKCIASTENQEHRRKPIRIADIISYYVLEVFVFDNTDAYSSILNKKDKFFIIFNKGILQNNKHQALDHINIPASQCPLYPMNLRTHLQKNGLIIRFSNKLSYIMLNLN